MIMTVNVPVIHSTSYSDTAMSSVEVINPPFTTDFNLDSVELSVETLILVEGTPIPGRGNLLLKHALLVQTEITSDGFLIRSREIDEEAFGSTYQAAYIDFLTSLRDRYHSLTRRQSRLSAQDRSVLDRLRNLLQ